MNGHRTLALVFSTELDGWIPVELPQIEALDLYKVLDTWWTLHVQGPSAGKQSCI